MNEAEDDLIEFIQLLVDDQDWKKEAKCRGAYKVFFPPKEAGNHYLQQQRDLCAACPVREECLMYGADEPVGRWGGKTPRQRSKLVIPGYGRVVKPFKGKGGVALGKGKRA